MKINTAIKYHYRLVFTQHNPSMASRSRRFSTIYQFLPQLLEQGWRGLFEGFGLHRGLLDSEQHLHCGLGMALCSLMSRNLMISPATVITAPALGASHSSFGSSCSEPRASDWGRGSSALRRVGQQRLGLIRTAINRGIIPLLFRAWCQY